MLTGLLQLLYNASDLIVCGSFGSENATAAISGTNSIINLIVNAFMGISLGANVLMARCFGQKDGEKAQRVVYTSMILALAIGLFAAVFGAIFARYFLVWINTPEEVIDLSSQYLTVYFIGAPFLMIYNFGASLLRAIGDTKRPFYFLTAAGIINVLLNLLFVIVFKLDVLGVAICTTVSQFLSAVMIMIYICKFKGFFHFKFREARFYWGEAGQIIRIGLPAGIQSAVFSLSNLMIQSSVNGFGEAVMGGNGAASSLEGFVYTAMNSVSQTSVSFSAANYGAKNKKNITRTIIYSLILILALNLVMGGIVMAFESGLLKLYIKKVPDYAAALKAGKDRLLVIMPTYFLCGWMEVFAFSLRAIGYSVLPMGVTIGGVCGLRLVWVFTAFKSAALHSMTGLVISYPISWALTAAVQLVFFIILFSRLKFGDSDGEKSDDGKNIVSGEAEKELDGESAA